MTNEEALALVRKGRYAEADEKIIEALEKQIPKKPTRRKFKCSLGCANCGSQVGFLLDSDGISKALFADAFCSGCGQAIDWSKDD